MADAQRKYELNHSTGRVFAALVGTMPAALSLGIALTLVLPLRLTERYLIGSYAVFPIWVALCVCVFLARSAKRAWLVILAIALVAGLVCGAAVGLRRHPSATEVRS